MFAYLLDRDGVINRERSDYVKSWDELELLPGALEALRLMATDGWPILVITNQSAIGRGIISAEQVELIHARLQKQVAEAGGRIDAFFICPHHPDVHCDCRKPQPGLLTQAADAFALDLSMCTFIGDSLTDLQAAEHAGCRSILVRSGRQGHQIDALVARHRIRERAIAKSTIRAVPIEPNLAAATVVVRRSAPNLASI